MKDPVSFSDKLFLWLTDKLGESQRHDIDRQIEADADLKHLVEELQDTDKVKDVIVEMDSFNVDKAWQAVSERATVSTTTRRQTGIKIFLRKYIIPLTAAAVLIGAVFFISLTRNTEPNIVLDPEIITAIAECDDHGMSGAIIEPDYVTAIPVKAAKIQEVKEKTAQPKDKEVVSEMLAAKRVTTLYNKEFWLTLPDGTVTHLARDTRIIYPEKFTDSRRDVYIEGEAYFIVAKDPSKRFVVHTKTATTTAYGTEFHIEANDESEFRIVLVNGSVGVSTNDVAEKILAPGEQAIVTDGDMTISEADIESVKAWNTGRFEFENRTLGDILDILAKWHGMAADIADPEIADTRLSGDLDRYDELTPTLESLGELIGIKFYIAGDLITVKRQ